MSSKYFMADHMCIVTSLKEIDSLEWVEYFIDNWEILMKKRSKLLVLAGIHGGTDGDIGPNDQNLLEDIERQIQRLKIEKATDIYKKKIEIILLDVGKFYDMSTETLDENQLVKRVQELDPTIISLAFCHTRTSILNDILRSVGVYSKIILSQDRYNITNGNVFTLDEEQKQIIEKISKTKGRNVILWGSHGTGKTLLLAEALSIQKNG